MDAVVPGLAIMATVVYFIQLEIVFQQQLAKKQFLAGDKEISANTYDFIIVGAGTAGCIVANKLSKSHQVLLLEQGGPAPSLGSVPGFRNYLPNILSIEHNYNTIRQPYLNNQRIFVGTGKMVGGSYGQSALTYVRGHIRDFEDWARVTKDKSFGFKNMQNIFKNLESYSGPFPSRYRGKTGPIPIHVTDSPVTRSFKLVANELGYNYSDSNGPMLRAGFAPVDTTASEDGRAVTTCSLLVKPINGVRQSLKVVTYANVEKINFVGNLATGVEYSRFGKKFYAGAQKEVILSAGAYGSPMLLFKSGIGPKKMILKAKIPLVADLPVGKVVKDHIEFTVGISRSPPPKSFTNVTLVEFNDYLNGKRDGVLSEVGEDVQGFFVSKTAILNGNHDRPDIQVVAGGHDAPYMILSINRLSSIGTLKLNTKKFVQGERDSTKLALIDKNFAHNPDDIRRLIEGLRITQQIVESRTLQDAGWKLLPNEDCARKEMLNTDAYWTCVIKSTPNFPSSRHPCCGCRVGFGDLDQGATVNPKFEVLRVRSLRIVDSSIMPEITSGNINAPTMALATKASLDIFNKYN